jgi:hypothetical protein
MSKTKNIREPEADPYRELAKKYYGNQSGYLSLGK